ncbi:hypothetical protein F5Y13DRAFT_190141 [Hypoxylon sp. FL1857]|nr:hypothetical protein F5Y13DRAFT_190141 [Hypoxylon sp. FL1857]
MSLLTKFQYFPILPREIQDMIWDFYRDQRGLRHYITIFGNVRFYASIDIDTNKFLRTYIAGTRVKKNLRWPLNGPISEKEFEVIRLRGKEHRIPEPGNPAKSIITATGIERVLWDKRGDLYVRARLESDLIFVDGGDPRMLLRSISYLNWGTLSVEDTHWFRRVRHLAIQLRPNQRVLDEASAEVITSLRNLENLYLVVYRDPQCVYGAPRNWRYFNKDLMDEYNFLPFEVFNKLHPKHRGKRCRCGTTASGAEDIQDDLEGALCDYRDIKDCDVDIRIVVDPY